MKKKTGVILLIVLLCVAMLGATAYAAVKQKNATLSYPGIVVLMDGKYLALKDAAGNAIEPFIIDGTTYLPLRAISEALGLDVQWDGETNAIYLSSSDTPNEEKAPEKDEEPVESFRISDGQYVVGEDIPAGKYDCRAVKGAGNFIGDVASLGGKYMLNVILGAPGSYWEGNETYSNLRLADGDTIEIRGGLTVEFVRK